MIKIIGDDVTYQAGCGKTHTIGQVLPDDGGPALVEFGAVLLGGREYPVAMSAQSARELAAELNAVDVRQTAARKSNERER